MTEESELHKRYKKYDSYSTGALVKLRQILIKEDDPVYSIVTKLNSYIEPISEKISILERKLTKKSWMRKNNMTIDFLNELKSVKNELIDELNPYLIAHKDLVNRINEIRFYIEDIRKESIYQH